MISILTSPNYSFWTMLRTSLIVMLITTTAVVVICSLAAFVFARMEFRGKGAFFNLFTLGLMFPITIAILPVYFVLRQMSMIDSLWGVILVQTAFLLSGNILIRADFLRLSLPNCRRSIDGCNAVDFSGASCSFPNRRWRRWQP
jgi:raffinose/stachyose/melibiose transport system permease protein